MGTKMAKVIIFQTPVRYGGGEKQLIILSREFKKRNLDFWIINLAKSQEFEQELKKEGINFLTITNKKLGDSPSKKKYFLYLFSLMSKIFNKNVKKLWQESDVVWARDFPANFFVYFLIKLFGKKNKKFIYSRHSHKNMESGITKMIYEKVLSEFDVLIGVSSLVSESLKKVFPKLKEKIIAIPNGVDSFPFRINESKEKLRKELKLPVDEVLGIYVARFAPSKNHIFLIEILKEIKNFKMILIGDGEAKEEFLNLVKKENLEERVICLGYVKNEIVPHYLKAVDFCLFPSKGEGFSNSILETMISGLPVVIFKDIYSAEYGPDILVAKDEKEFVEMVKKIIENENLRKELGEKVKLCSKNFDISNVCENYLKLFAS
jgi:glycosyltransferase involved in cell wall biosynthesis